MFGPAGASTFTQSVIDIKNLIYSDTQVKDSLYEQASIFFGIQDDDKARVALQVAKVDEAKKEVETASWTKSKAAKQQLEAAEAKLASLKQSIENDRVKRLDKCIDICTRLIRLSEGTNGAETAQNSAKLLGTILLLSPGDGPRLQVAHQRFKPMYKAVLAVRLLDKLLTAGMITNKYILQHYEADRRYPENPEDDLTEFQREVVIPVMMASIYQDVGMLHLDAVKLLKGPKGDLDEFRLLEGDDRIQMLKLNHKHSLDYMSHGLGALPYRGDDKTERKAFKEREKAKLVFIRTMLNDAIKPKQGLGNLIKVPQIYTSVILSTKAGYDVRELPKAALLLEQVAKKGAVDVAAAEKLVEIVGYFPQGYGIAYIPKDDQDRDLDRYEYAIVTGLNPQNPKVPQCRLVTRNLEYIAFGNDARISVERNLYFPNTRKKLQRVSPERLKEILSKLYHDFEQRGAAELIPRCWQPYDYFSFRNNQNLWNRKLCTTI
ncbi:hypothetical protein OE749_01410 [Aestuariibacter sp. AA17]|uniref:Uncharacterized protein n=1 Tax=Fluctibacter corallii TaxID=2984329 RepID=A0ABT3A3U3_9ALTE|nr:hypothetical protein [Aestuariibacter sp. AA17]MCV2883353.1 hypothetical protein [Aestuariibacter sp. AA17]